jgi:hypothetical protein
MAPKGCGSPVTQVLAILRAGTRDAGLQSRAPNPNYAKTVQKEPMVVQWRKQIVEWIVEVRGPSAAVVVTGADPTFLGQISSPSMHVLRCDPALHVP